ncbi:MAG: proteasome-type protease [Rhodospirillales bacterium]
MTYCVGVMVDSGLVLASDSRTNAGVDHIMTYRKMTVFEKPSDRVIVLLSAGNLAITQAVVNLLKEYTTEADETLNLLEAKSMFRVARIVGNAIREVHKVDAPHLHEYHADFNANFILGGQIKGGQTRLFQVYTAGNFIEASPETPFMQIGETKYGKPVLDRIVTPHISLEEAAKCLLVSYTSTLRSNVSVGLPIDLVMYRKDSLKIESKLFIEEGDPYFTKLNADWSNALSKAFENIENPNFRRLNGV